MTGENPKVIPLPQQIVHKLTNVAYLINTHANKLASKKNYNDLYKWLGRGNHVISLTLEIMMEMD